MEETLLPKKNGKLLISHRGNLKGRELSLENNPKQIDFCINLGFDIEIDLRYENKKWWIGHDSPQYEISIDYLLDRKRFLWCHCKNFSALDNLQDFDLNYFWHGRDDHTITSKNYIWTLPGKEIGKNNIIVLPELNMSIDEIKNLECFGICSDYIELFE